REEPQQLHTKLPRMPLASVSKAWRQREASLPRVQGASRLRASAWHAEEEGGSTPGFGLDPNATPVALDNSFADRQPHSGAGVFGIRVQALEDPKHGFLVLGWHADAIIRDAEHPLSFNQSGRDLDL